MIGIGLVGYGYWGPNLARNFNDQPDAKLVAICETSKARADQAATRYPATDVTADYRALLDNSDIHAIAIATPVSSHDELTRAALVAGKDVLVEKPLTQTASQAAELVRLAEANDRVLAVDHTFLYTGAVRKIKQLVDDGELGELVYFDSVRINLGLFQHDVNVIWDLAPHDLSIVCHLLDSVPTTVQAVSAKHSDGFEYMAYVHLEFANGVVAHFHLNWLSPVKIRRTLIAGTDKMVVYDDLEQTEKVKVYDKGVHIKEADLDSIHKVRVDYRSGDMVAPKLERQEALAAEAAHFLQCVRDRQRPIADGRAGLRIVSILEATELSIRRQGERVSLEEVSCTARS